MSKSIFFTSDWHIDHENALVYDDRPFSSLDYMHQALITRYNSTVPKDGICYFLGDMGNRPAEIKKVIEKLNGTRILILGNHDKKPQTMYNCGFDVVLYNTTLYYGTEKITLSHCPLLGVYREDTKGMRGMTGTENWHGENRPMARMFSLPDTGQFHLHGHIHSRKGKTSSTKILGKQFDVGVPGNNYTPVSWAQIVSFITLYNKAKATE